ncbi:MAG: DUF5606 domain-containing protein [Muribaculaceae bacterium]|nr:DUF5606 domain-containing protein [Muribaculaceae bacterium]
MLKKILCITGRSGLFELKSYGKNMVIVESLIDHKRSPAYSREKIVSLGDIAIYTTAEDKPLAEVLETIRDKYEGKPLDLELIKTDQQIDEFFAAVLPNYDVDRVHRSDIKKLAKWYNILVGAGITEFKAEAKEEQQDSEAAKPADDTPQDGTASDA